MKKNILVGNMGSGKSAVGEYLAEVSGIKHYDLDHLIEQSEQKSITDIFRQHGEIYFRKAESRFFREFLQKQEPFILSLGGGTPCYADNHLLLQHQDVFSVYLKTPVAVLVERLKNEKQKRPLLAHLPDSEVEEFVNKLLFDRSFYYHQAKYILNTEGKTIAEIAQEILTKSK
ncbi:MAG: shikimate kinase [Flavobacteriaceae bacterium]